MAGHQMQQRERILRSGGLVLAGNQLAIDHDFRCVRLNAGIDRASPLEDRLRIMRDDESASEHRLKLLVPLKCESGHLTTFDPVRNIAESDRTVADGADDFILGPEILQRLRYMLVGEQIEGRTTAACYVDRIVLAQINVLQLQGRL